MAFPPELRIKFKDLIAHRSGLYFRDHDLRNLESAIEQRIKVKKFDSFATYYSHLIVSDKKDDEFRELLNLLTINHTYFFRNKPHFITLREKVLPAIIERKRREHLRNSDQRLQLRIWSAGCSSGEEPYSIAMTIADLIDDLENWDINVLATDASQTVLAKAQKGIYQASSMRHVDDVRCQKYFTQKTNNKGKCEYEISSDIKKMVSFGFFNLMDEDYPMGFDIIFCRNVVIYFELKTTIEVMSKFYNSLVDDGCMFIGYSETLQFIKNKFQMATWKDAIYYFKNIDSQNIPLQGEQVGEEKKPVDIDKVLGEIARAEALAKMESQPIAGEAPKKLEDIIVAVTKHLHLKEYDQGLDLITQGKAIDEKSTDLFYLQAEILMNQGKSDEAKNSLEEALKLNSLFIPAHYLNGCICFEEDRFEDAQESLRKALFLDNDFLIAHFYLAQVFKQEDKADDAIRQYRNTLKLLSSKSSDTIIAYSGGFNAATLMSVCRDNLERLKFGIFTEKEE